jgi:hypothetical protein
MQMLDRGHLERAIGKGSENGRLVDHAMVMACKGAGKLGTGSFRDPLARVSREDPSLEVRQAAHAALAALR